MDKIILAVCLLVSLSVHGYSQPGKASRYRDCIFTKITVQKNTSYAAIIPEAPRKNAIALIYTMQLKTAV
ncbi:MAG TPA: hypothetical protein VKA49_03680 [Flavitalea sp.]|nr:hypothetical protein [Flavitalea sp.]